MNTDPYTRLLRLITIDPDTNCWIWQGNSQARLLTEGKQTDLAYRVAYRRDIGEIPEGMALAKTCSTEMCVNPAHRAVAPRGSASANRAKTHCIHGHEFTPENTYRAPSGNRRQCKKCMAVNQKTYRSKKVK